MSYQNRGNAHNKQAVERLDTSNIKLSTNEGECLSANLFDSIAHDAAKTVGSNFKSNAPTQIRKFYDDVVMWSDKVEMHQDKFAEYLPFIRMLNAKAAYAQGRQHVDNNFKSLISHCLNQVNSPHDMRNFKLFFEAFMGFYKLERPKK